MAHRRHRPPQGERIEVALTYVYCVGRTLEEDPGGDGDQPGAPHPRTE